MFKTAICDLFEIEYPIIQGGMGPGDTTELAAAVSKVGALGLVSAGMAIRDGMAPLEAVMNRVERVRTVTDRPFGINVPINMDYSRETIQALIAARRRDASLARQLRVIFMSAGDSGPYIQELHEEGMICVHVVPTVYHAQRMERMGVDAVVASGYEGGGHLNPDPVNTIVLVPAVVEAVKVPVIAAGGFGDARSFVAAFALGAQGVQMGTRFVATQDAIGFHSNVREYMLTRSTRDTIVTRGTVGPGRALKNEFTLALDKMVQEHAPEEEVLRFKDWGRERAIVLGDVEHGWIPCGQIVGRIHDLPMVKELVEDRIMKGSQEVLRELARLAGL